MTRDGTVHPLASAFPDLQTPAEWCSGCGLGIVLQSLLRAVQECALAYPKSLGLVLSEMGCLGLLSRADKFPGQVVPPGELLSQAFSLANRNPKRKIILLASEADVLVGGWAAVLPGRPGLGRRRSQSLQKMKSVGHEADRQQRDPRRHNPRRRLHHRQPHRHNLRHHQRKPRYRRPGNHPPARCAHWRKPDLHRQQGTRSRRGHRGRAAQPRHPAIQPGLFQGPDLFPRHVVFRGVAGRRSVHHPLSHDHRHGLAAGARLPVALPLGGRALRDAASNPWNHEHLFLSRHSAGAADSRFLGHPRLYQPHRHGAGDRHIDPAAEKHLPWRGVALHGRRAGGHLSRHRHSRHRLVGADGCREHGHGRPAARPLPEAPPDYPGSGRTQKA